MAQISTLNQRRVKGSALSHDEVDDNWQALQDFVNLLGGAFDDSGQVNISAPAAQNLIKTLLPFFSSVGTVRWSPCEIATPASNGIVYLEADGSAKNKTDYPQLAALYGTKYNLAGDDATTVFRLPNLKSRFLYGRAAAGGEISGNPAASGSGGFGGEATHLLTAAESGMPSHSHPLTAAGAANGSPGGISYENTFVSTQTATQAAASQDAAAAHNNMPPYATGVFYIVAGYKIAGVMQS